MSDKPTFVRKERAHLDVLGQRLDHLREDDPTRIDNPGYIAGEANALAWALSVLTGSLDPIDVRLERHERRIKNLESRFGRLEHDLLEED
jgi:hypothetical protein